MPILTGIIGVLSFVLYVNNMTLNSYRSVHYMDSIGIERRDRHIQKQDSLINALYDIKATKITIIEKDTVR